MTIEVKDYLSNLSDLKDENYFYLYKFYLNPLSVLGGNERTSLYDYQNYGNIDKLVLNNTFQKFLLLCLKDKDFIPKIDDVLLLKIRQVLFDSKAYIENYVADLKDEAFRNFFDKDEYLAEKYLGKYNIVQLLSLKDLYAKIGWIYKIDFDENTIKKYNLNLNKSLIDTVDLFYDIYNEANIKPIKDGKTVLKLVENDNYQNVESCFLYRYDIDSKLLFNSLVCNNEFVRIIGEIISNKSLPVVIIRKIILILETGINIKTYNAGKQNYLVKDDIKSNFNYKEAEKLLSELNILILRIKRKKDNKKAEN